MVLEGFIRGHLRVSFMGAGFVPGTVYGKRSVIIMDPKLQGYRFNKAIHL